MPEQENAQTMTEQVMEATQEQPNGSGQTPTNPTAPAPLTAEDVTRIVAQVLSEHDKRNQAANSRLANKVEALKKQFETVSGQKPSAEQEVKIREEAARMVTEEAQAEPAAQPSAKQPEKAADPVVSAMQIFAKEHGVDVNDPEILKIQPGTMTQAQYLATATQTILEIAAKKAKTQVPVNLSGGVPNSIQNINDIDSLYEIGLRQAGSRR